MIAQEAKEILINRQSVLVKNTSLEKNPVIKTCMSDEYKAINIAFDALQKQIPRRLDYKGDGYADNGELDYDTAICRSCNRHFEFYYEEHYNYCPTCGQALDWSEEVNDEYIAG